MRFTLKNLFATALGVVSFFARVTAEVSLPADVNVSTSHWNGFEKRAFQFDGRNALVVFPKTPRKDAAWILRPAFFGAFANADVELAARGFYIVYCDFTHGYASPRTLDSADKFYMFMTQKCGFAKKVGLEGLSRGGAFCLNWANRDPSKVAAVYVDAPVCDFLIWPCEKSPNLKDALMKEWNITSLNNFRGSPIFNFLKLAKSGVPMLIVAGDSDKTVPFDLNGAVYKKNFESAGGKIALILKNGCGHHPHGLVDPTPIVDFMESAYCFKR